MKRNRVTVELTEEEITRLQELADRERRTPSKQAAVLLAPHLKADAGLVKTPAKRRTLP